MLNRLMVRAGLAYVEGDNSELVTMPFTDLPSGVEKCSARSTGPWVEGVYRRAAAPLLPIPLRHVSTRFLARAVA